MTEPSGSSVTKAGHSVKETAWKSGDISVSCLLLGPFLQTHCTQSGVVNKTKLIIKLPMFPATPAPIRSTQTKVTEPHHLL